jgi:hypothetical protein
MSTATMIMITVVIGMGQGPNTAIITMATQSAIGMAMVAGQAIQVEVMCRFVMTVTTHSHLKSSDHVTHWMHGRLPH